MTLSKEVKDIIEDVYTFLSYTLKCDNLSDSTDSIRRKLLSQIKKFAQANQSFRISLQNDENEKSALSLPYDSQPVHLNNGCLYRLSTSSGSTSYSNGFSGDDTTSPPQTIVEDTSSAEDNEDFYEEFEENNEFSSLQTSSNGDRDNYKLELFLNDNKSVEDSYSIVKNVPFRNIIARCDHHGIINKRSKTFLKNSRYYGVIADGLLYLYSKESDDKPKRVIDLAEYKVRCNSTEDSKRKKEFSFLLVALGKKTHTFSLTTSRERNLWVDTLNCAVSTRNSYASKINNDTTAKHLLVQHTQFNMCYKPTECFTDQIDGELYEEITENRMPYQRFSQQDDNMLSSKIEEPDGQHKYYEVPLEEDVDIKTFLPSAESTPIKKLIKPERPPLPDILRQKMDQSRPLPPEPPTTTSGNTPYDPSIYWEIEHDSSFEKDDDNSSLMTPSLHSRSLSQEIFDTIKERVPLLPSDSKVELSSYTKDGPAVNDIEYEVPSDLHIDTGKHCSGDVGQCAYQAGNNSVYQIPTNSWKVCDIYQIPPTPVPVLNIKSTEDVSAIENPTFAKETSSAMDDSINDTTPDKILLTQDYKCDVIQDHCEDSKDLEEPISSVKELIRKINDQSKLEKTNFLPRNSIRKLSQETVNFEDTFIQYHSNVIPPIPKENECLNIDDEDVITICIESPELLCYSTLDVTAGTFVAKFAYVGKTSEELSFSRGDSIMVIDASQNTWWKAELRGKKGIVHRDYLRRSDC